MKYIAHGMVVGRWETEPFEAEELQQGDRVPPAIWNAAMDMVLSGQARHVGEEHRLLNVHGAQQRCALCLPLVGEEPRKG